MTGVQTCALPICSFEFSIPTFDANVFLDNYSALGGALSFLRATGGGLVSNNLFNNNGSTFFGGAIALVSSSPTLANNTVVNNVSIYGGGLYCNESSNPLVYNTIFWGNNAEAGYGMQVFIWDALSAPEFYNSNFEHGPLDFKPGGFDGVYENCIELNPLFDDSGNWAFELSEDSPNIDVGTNLAANYELPELDLTGNSRVSNNAVDIGAFEYQFPLNISLNQKNQILSVAYYYSRSYEELFISAVLPYEAFVSIELYNIQGKLLSSQNIGRFDAGRFDLSITGFKGLIPGLYIGRLSVGKDQAISKFIVY